MLPRKAPEDAPVVYVTVGLRSCSRLELIDAVPQFFHWLERRQVQLLIGEARILDHRQMLEAGVACTV